MMLHLLQNLTNFDEEKACALSIIRLLGHPNLDRM